jgi:hypothetical protein
MAAIEREHDACATLEEFDAMWVALTDGKGWDPSRANAYLIARLYGRMLGQLTVRDKFICDRGLWMDFVDQLPSKPE